MYFPHGSLPGPFLTLEKYMEELAIKASLNQTVIQRYDPQLVEILDISSHVVVYFFDATTQTWVRSLQT